ncbi:MAG: hypothetical protein IH810_05470 [Proteobacteria bacterium]|nr:hypothetical protein [Pseudomonadota bacterium]
MPLSAAARRAGDVSRRYFWVPLRFPKLRVAGSNPVSRSKIHAASHALSGLAALRLGLDLL